MGALNIENVTQELLDDCLSKYKTNKDLQGHDNAPQYHSPGGDKLCETNPCKTRIYLGKDNSNE